MKETLDKLRTLLGEVQDLKAAGAVLGWDQETYMPSGSAQARAYQISTLEKLAHEQFTSAQIGRLLDRLEPELVHLDPESDEAALIRVTREDFEKAQKLPTSLVQAFAQTTALALHAWRSAREASDFSPFQPHLEKIVDLNRQKAEALGYSDRIYDALLDQFEPGMTTQQVADTFSALRADLVPIVHTLSNRKQPDDDLLHQPFDDQHQWDFGLEVIKDFGFNFETGRQDRSTHPFTTNFAISDVRLTTRVDPKFFSPAFFGTLHECGHGLYEQGVAASLGRTPLAAGTSLGMHESQSRLWENLVGRSLGFWTHYYPRLQQVFPGQLADASLDAFYGAINRVSPSLIRVEADEVTYNLHIMLRFELENAMLEGTMAIADLPEVWNARMEEYFGLTPPNDAEGCLQDIHWSMGAFGYFPTYALGNLMSVQLFNQAAEDLDDLPGQIADGTFLPLLGWLRTNIHQHGRKFDADTLLRRCTGQSLDATPWLNYIRTKYDLL
jgi:carboxypeptidase Taq